MAEMEIAQFQTGNGAIVNPIVSDRVRGFRIVRVSVSKMEHSKRQHLIDIGVACWYMPYRTIDSAIAIAGLP